MPFCRIGNPRDPLKPPTGLVLDRPVLDGLLVDAPVVKIVFCLNRRADIGAAEFSRYWRDEHAQLFAQYADALRVTRYTQSHRLDHPLNAALRATRSAPDGYDGVAEVWFDSLDALTAGVLSPPGRAAGAALIEDEKRFIDHATSPIWVVDEVEIPLSGPGPS